MGAYLSQPITDKESSDGEDDKFKYGTTAMQGWRTNMEVRPHAPQGTLRHPGLFFIFSLFFRREASAAVSRPAKFPAPPHSSFPVAPAALPATPTPRVFDVVSLPVPSPNCQIDTWSQDAHATVLGLDEDTAFFGVYDGHGGKEVRSMRLPAHPSHPLDRPIQRGFSSSDPSLGPSPPTTKKRKTRPCRRESIEG